MNHGGLAGSVFALESRFTGYDADTVILSHLDGGKMDLRIDPLDAVDGRHRSRPAGTR